MKLTITLDINNCYECPFNKYVSTHGFCSDVCAIDKNPYACTPQKGIREDCPCLKNKTGNFTLHR